MTNMGNSMDTSTTRFVQVDLAERSYGIDIGVDLLDRLGSIARRAAPSARCAVISDRTVANLYAAQATASLERAGYQATLLTFPPGDASKSLAQAERLYDCLAAAGIDRSDLIVTLGGGVTGDLGGFVAATWLRGVPFIQAPTTLEADVDASVGGKVAVNHASGKNMIGAFYQPRRVVIDVACLRTLDRRDLVAGLAESVKHGLTRDPDFFAWHETHADAVLRGDGAILAELIEKNCRIKASVVTADERESRLRAILNFGHTFGHAIESQMQYQWRHGECVAVGMMAACRIGQHRATISPGEVARIESLLTRLGLQTRLPAGIRTDDLLDWMRRDKKVKAGRIQFVLPKGIGEVYIADDVAEAELRDAAEAVGAKP
jgi:3-dehydroquinate synthase